VVPEGVIFTVGNTPCRSGPRQVPTHAHSRRRKPTRWDRNWDTCNRRHAARRDKGSGRRRTRWPASETVRGPFSRPPKANNPPEDFRQVRWVKISSTILPHAGCVMISSYTAAVVRGEHRPA
jgi:hypothetical protein